MSPNKNDENQSKETDTMNRDRAGLLPTVASPQPPEQLMEWRRRLLFLFVKKWSSANYESLILKNVKHIKHIVGIIGIFSLEEED